MTTVHTGSGNEHPPSGSTPERRDPSVGTARLARLARRLLAAEAALVFAHDDRRWLLQAVEGAAAAAAAEWAREFAPHLGKPGPGTLLTTGDGVPLTVLVAPLSGSFGRVIGCCCVLRPASRPWDSGDATLLSDLATPCGAEIERERTGGRDRRSLDERAGDFELIETLSRVAQSLAAEQDLERLVQVITDAGTELSGAEFGAFFHNVTGAAPDGSRAESYSLYSLSGVGREAFARFPMPRNTAVFRPTFQGEGVVRSDDITRDLRYGQSAPHHGMPEGHLPVHSYLAVPVASRSGEVLGGLFFGHSAPGVFREEHERLLVAVASQAAIAIDNARLLQNARAAEERFRDLVNGVEAIFWEADARTFRFTFVSERARGLLGYPPAEWVSQPDFWLRVLHPEDRHWVTEHRLSEIAEGQDHQFEYRLRAADGRDVWVRDLVYVVKDSRGKPAQLRGVMLDVTARSGAQAELAESEERLRQALEAGRLGTWDWNIRTDELRWSETLQCLHGLPPGSFTGRIDAFLHDMHPDDREAVLQSVQRALTEGAEHYVEYRIVTPDGSQRWVLGCGRVLRDDEDVPLRMVGVCMDITTRKEAELASLRLVEELQRQLEEANRRLAE